MTSVMNKQTETYNPPLIRKKIQTFIAREKPKDKLMYCKVFAFGA